MGNLLTLDFFKGKKTYILAAALVAYAVGGVITGNLTVKDALELFGLGSIGATLRKALE